MADEDGRKMQLQEIKKRVFPAIYFTLHHLCVEAKKFKEWYDEMFFFPPALRRRVCSVLLSNTIVDEGHHEYFTRVWLLKSLHLFLTPPL